MKRIFLITIGMVLCFSMTACTSKQEVAQITEENVEVSKNRKEVEAMASTIVTDNEEEIIEIVVGEEDEIISDVDVDSNELTMEDMEELQLGLDIPVLFIDGDSSMLNDFNDGDFRVLFPQSMYHTSYSDNGLRAELESIDFVLTADIRNDMEIPTVEEERCTLEYIGKYVLEIEFFKNSKYALMKSYRIYNSETNRAIFIGLTINKVENYQDYCNSLIDEFVPAFEEVLISNFE